MKKKYLIIIAGLLVSLTGCKKKFNRSLPSTIVDVVGQYGVNGKEKVETKLYPETDIKGYKIYDYKTEEQVKKSDIHIGDRLYVYYKTEEYKQIDFIFVQRCEFIRVKVTQIGGFSDIYVDEEEPKTYVETMTNYVINKDSTFTWLMEFPNFTELYGVYLDGVDTHTTDPGKPFETRMISLRALYTYKIK